MMRDYSHISNDVKAEIKPTLSLLLLLVTAAAAAAVWYSTAMAMEACRRIYGR